MDQTVERGETGKYMNNNMAISSDVSHISIVNAFTAISINVIALKVNEYKHWS